MAQIPIPETPSLRTLHRGMFAVDIASFGSRRDPDVQRYLRSSIHRIVRDSCRAAGLDWDACHHEDRGDGLFVIAGPDAGIDVLLQPLVVQLLAGVRRHNKLAGREAQIQLRVAVHAGYLQLDEHGATGVALNHLFRLLAAAPLKYRLAEVSGDFALIVSHHLFEEVVAYSVGVIEPSAFTCVPVMVKETHDRGWVWLPPVAAGGASVEPAAGTAQLAVLLAAVISRLDEIVQHRP
ncbi:hypothetical protein [Actinomadura latina]|uniref:Guanylate cyclase domain-containing protein n=1 Tax=Actinomadura latina TaxID=163603 RepID=A0A846YPS9_9ACTN|nr:hypothetical protein [Actinomadura latina]NKZ02219.1 hypothetical protein [Actinomadura latina]